MKNNQVQEKYNLMVVDGQPEVGGFLYDFFNNKGYDVVKTASGETAVQMIRTEKPKILLLDVELTGKVDGVKVLQFAKKIIPDAKVIIMTGTTDKKIIEEMFVLGAEECIQKPFSLNYLEQVVMMKIANLENEKLNI